MSEFRFDKGQRVRIKGGRFPLSNPDDYQLIGQVGTVVRSWNPRRGTGDEYIARSEDIQFFELNHYDIRIGDNVYLFNEDWLEEE
jgi:hypothetical protein